jgi:hypothetical protein
MSSGRSAPSLSKGAQTVGLAELVPCRCTGAAGLPELCTLSTSSGLHGTVVRDFGSVLARVACPRSAPRGNVQGAHEVPTNLSSTL